MSELTRRQFCVVTGAGLVAGACGNGATMNGGNDLAVPDDLAMPVITDMADTNCPVNGKLNAGPQSALLVGHARFFPCAQMFVLRDTLGIYAMTAVCTHEGCIVNFVGAQQGFLCPCHTSTYDFNGMVTSPPAPHPLQHYSCALDGADNIIVDRFVPVIATTRLTIQD